MNVSTQLSDNKAIVTVKADKLEALVAPELKSEFLMANKDKAKDIIVDLSGVRYCDSSGLSALLVGNRLCKEADGVFVIAGVNATVKKIIIIAQLDKVLNIVDTVEEAEKKISELAN